MRAKRLLATVVTAGIATLAAAGCSTEARAERKGKEFGDQVCKVKSANSDAEAQRHLRRAQDKLDDLARFAGHDVRSDLRDVDRNLDQLVRDLQRGKDVRQQDVNAVVNNANQAAATSHGAAKAAYDGMVEGLNGCN